MISKYIRRLFHSLLAQSNCLPFRLCKGNVSGLETWIRKSKDYVYGIWVYKALDIWKGYYRVKKSLVWYVKPWTEARNNKYMKYHSKLTYQLSFWNGTNSHPVLWAHNSHPVLWAHNPLWLRQYQPIFRLTNHKKGDIRPCIAPHPTDSPTATSIGLFNSLVYPPIQCNSICLHYISRSCGGDY